MTQGFLFTHDDVPADAATDFALRMRHAADADEGRTIIREHEAAINAEERRLGLPPTVGDDGSGYYSRGFSTLRPNELKTLAARSLRCAELVRQGKEMHPHWQRLLAASLAEWTGRYAPTGSEDDDDGDADDTDAGEDADTPDTEPDEWTGADCLDWRREGNRCTLDGQPARIIGRTAPYATIEPVDLDADPIYCPWEVVAQILDERDGAFVRADAE